MKFSRRELVAGLAVSALAQKPPAPPPSKPRTAPLICLHSQSLQRLHYSELGPILQGMGVEGCDLTIRPGGHVIPERAPADLVRAIEGIRDEGVLVAMVTTGFTNPADPWARNVLAISGGMGVPFFQPGYWTYGAGDVEARLLEVKREMMGMMLIGRSYNIAMGVHNRTGEVVGEAVWDTRSLIADQDPRWLGYCFDPSQAMIAGAAGGWLMALRMAVPRLKMAALSDFTWAKDGGKAAPKPCPMGEGVVDWQKFFTTVAQARFTGPLSVRMEYSASDEPVAIGRDLEFVRKQVAAAYGNVS